MELRHSGVIVFDATIQMTGSSRMLEFRVRTLAVQCSKRLTLEESNVLSHDRMVESAI